MAPKHNLLKLGSFFHVGVHIFICSLLVEPVQSADERYELCKPRNCSSGPSISYPFYFTGVGADICGFPGFEVSCEDDKPTVGSYGGYRYLLDDISYENQSFRLVSEDAINSSCVAPLHNFSFGRAPLRFSSSYAELVFFYNCTKAPTSSSSVSQMKLPQACDSIATNSSFLVLVPDGNMDLDGLSMTCEHSAIAPVDLDLEAEKFNQTKDTLDYTSLLKKGFTLEWIGPNCVKCERSGGRCGYEAGDTVCYCVDRPHANHCNEGKGRLALKLGLAISAAGVGILVSLAFLFGRKFTFVNSMVFWKKKTVNYQDIDAFLQDYGSLCPKRYSYLDIKKITDEFKDKLGEGGFGGVYRGKLHDGRLVAVKILKESIKGNGEDFINEVSSISRTSHINVVTLLGFCFEGHKRALVYEFMANGSLEKFIYEKNSVNADRQLKWKTLYRIAIGIARGLEYLHRGCNTRILHFDIKPHNILLDGDFCPKISDFGLAKICPSKESIVSMFGTRGTAGYIAPEVFSRNFGRVSHKSDVYSYGMMVFEIVAGRKNVEAGAAHSSQIYYPHWIYKRLELNEELELQGIVNEEDKQCARKMVIVSMWCIQTDPLNRPPMSRVVEMLEGSLESLQIPPKPFLYSPAISPPDSPTILSS